MHRLLVNATDNQDVDHINGNGLDNRLVNLRVCSRAENMCNRKPSRTGTSKYLGVSLRKNRWVSQITKNRKCKNLGSFISEVEAALAYDAAAEVVHGSFGRLNRNSFNEVMSAYQTKQKG